VLLSLSGTLHPAVARAVLAIDFGVGGSMTDFSLLSAFLANQILVTHSFAVCLTRCHREVAWCGLQVEGEYYVIKQQFPSFLRTASSCQASCVHREQGDRFTALQAAGIDHISVEFDGMGDSGQIESIRSVERHIRKRRNGSKTDTVSYTYTEL
jgi:hypothetical protein